MTPFAIILVLVSCMEHATWNLLSKRSGSTVAFLCAANLAVLALGLPFFLLCDGYDVLAAPVRLWLFLLLTGLCLAAYFKFLAMAYRNGDVSVAYLRDVLMRMHAQPADRLHELILRAWQKRLGAYSSPQAQCVAQASRVCRRDVAACTNSPHASGSSPIPAHASAEPSRMVLLSLVLGAME